MMEYMLAAENRRSKIGVQYYWRIFDVEKKGRLTLSTLNLFLRDINAKMASLRLEVMPIENMTVRFIKIVYCLKITTDFDCFVDRRMRYST